MIDPQIGGNLCGNAVVNVGDAAFQRPGVEPQVHGGEAFRFIRRNVLFPCHAVEHMVAPFQVAFRIIEPVIGPGIAGYVAEEQVAQLGVLHIARTLVHKAEALLYQCGFPHERGAVCIVQHDIEGGIGGLVVELGNLIAEESICGSMS